MPVRGFDGPNLAKDAVKGEVAQTSLNFVDLLVAPAIDKCRPNAAVTRPSSRAGAGIAL